MQKFYLIKRLKMKQQNATNQHFFESDSYLTYS